MNQQNLADFIWSVADVLRGDFRQSEFGRIILPFTVLRRLECVLEPTRDKVRNQYQAMQASGVDMDLILPTTAGATFYNVSQFALASVGSPSDCTLLTIHKNHVVPASSTNQLPEQHLLVKGQRRIECGDQRSLVPPSLDHLEKRNGFRHWPPPSSLCPNRSVGSFAGHRT